MSPLTTLALLAASLPPTLAASAHVNLATQHADHENWRLVKYTAYTWAVSVAALIVYRWTLYLLRHVRTLANLNQGTSSDGRQRYFSIPDEKFAKIKRHLISAPLLNKRHNREVKLSAAMNVGTVPARLQTLFLLGYLAMNIVFCTTTINWQGKQFYDGAMDRFGILAVLNMIPLFLLAGRNNPLIWSCGISFDTYNLIHRWLGRTVIFESIAHVAFWMAGKIDASGSEKGWQMIQLAISSSRMMRTGTIAVCALIFILFQSPSIVRHAFYETFLGIHQILAIVATVTIWIHLKKFPSQKNLLAGAVACWAVERAWRFWSLASRNVGAGVTKAEVEALPGDAVRVTLRLARPWQFKPGQHVYMYMPSVGLWTSHPFSLAWSEEQTDFPIEKGLPMVRQDMFASRTRTMSLIIRRRTGFTDKMFKKAEVAPGGKFVTTAFVEGPYGNQSFHSYGTVMLFAAGVGITHQVPHVRDLVQAYANGLCATRKIVLVWIIQSPEHLEWIRPWMTQILGMDKRRDILKILLFVTRPRSTKEIHSPSSSVQMFPGKPDVAALIEKEQMSQIGAMSVSVCGTGSLADDVRKAVRDRCERTEIDFSEESYSW